MEHQIKQLVEATTNAHLKGVVQNNVKALEFENNHLTIYVHNAGALHELESDNLQEPLNHALEAVYGKDITYEVKLWNPGEHEREKLIPHVIHGQHQGNH